MLHEAAHALAQLRSPPTHISCTRSALPCSTTAGGTIATDTPPRSITPRASLTLSPAEQICRQICRQPAGMLVNQSSRATGRMGRVICISPPALRKHPLFPLPSAGELHTDTGMAASPVVGDGRETEARLDSPACSTSPSANAELTRLSTTTSRLARIPPGLTPLAWEAATAPGSALNGKCASAEMRYTRSLSDTCSFVLG